MGLARRAGYLAAATAAASGLAYRFALAYRARAGFPRRYPPTVTPADLGLPYVDTVVHSGEIELPAWFIPARGGAPGPGVALIHGWESARDRTLPNAVFLHAAGFHCLTIDVRGHGANPPEELPLTTGEFGLDAGATFAALIERPEVTTGAVFGHSMGAVGALLAAAADPRVAAVVATSAPADSLRLTRLTFRLAHLPFPDVVAYPLAWLTMRVHVAPRGHRPPELSASTAAARYRGPMLLAHGTDDAVVPYWHLAHLEAAARDGRPGAGAVDGTTAAASDVASIETLTIPGGQHSWLYEFRAYRAGVAEFLARALGGPLAPDEAARIAGATPAERIPDGEQRFAGTEGMTGGFRTLARVVRPGALQPIDTTPLRPTPVPTIEGDGTA